MHIIINPNGSQIPSFFGTKWILKPLPISLCRTSEAPPRCVTFCMIQQSLLFLNWSQVGAIQMISPKPNGMPKRFFSNYAC